MEAVPYDWNDYLSSEGLSHTMHTGSAMHGDPTGQAGPPITDLDLLHNRLASRKRQTGDAAEWSSTPTAAGHNQHLAGQYNLHNAEESQGYGMAGGVHLDYEEDLAPATLDNDTVASQNQYRHHGSASSLETSEGVSNPAVPVAPQQAPGLESVSEAEVERELKAFFRDQDLLKVLKKFPDTEASFFECRVPGCQWTTKDLTSSLCLRTNMDYLIEHESSWGRLNHYGKPGDWRCREVGCKFGTKRFSDFKRHSSSKHCIKPKNLGCPVLECKYHQLGFTRKDKLKSHLDKVHKVNFRPGKPNQVIKPKVNDCAYLERRSCGRVD
ncbi:MAG: hypothetical protein Q9161_002256 [Pseudevernia consocians]